MLFKKVYEQVLLGVEISIREVCKKAAQIRDIFITHTAEEKMVNRINLMHGLDVKSDQEGIDRVYEAVEDDYGDGRFDQIFEVLNSISLHSKVLHSVIDRVEEVKLKTFHLSVWEN